MKILVFAPHNDDEVLGVGGTIAKYARSGHEVYICESTSGPNYIYMQKQAREAHAILGVKDSYFLNLPLCRLKEAGTPEKNQAFLNIVSIAMPCGISCLGHIKIGMKNGENK